MGKFFTDSGLDTVETLTGNYGGPISPDGAHNINILGVGGISVTGSGHSLYITSASGGNVFTATTVDATPTTLFLFAVPASAAIVIYTTIVGARADYGAAIAGTINGGARRGAAGSTAFIGVPTVNFDQDSGGGSTLSFTMLISGNDIIVQVTGVAATTYNWKGYVEYQALP